MLSMIFKISLVLLLFKSCERSSSPTSSDTPIEYEILWEPAGEIGHRVYCLLNTGTVLFAGTYNGLFTSADSGRTWTNANNGLTIATIRAMAEKDGILFAAGGILEGGISVSHDTGKSWADTKTGLPNTSVSSLAVSGKNIYAGTFAYGVFVSEDNGKQWRPINKGLPSTFGDVTALAADGPMIVACINSDTSGVYMSMDQGANWRDINRGLPPDHADFTSLLIRKNDILVSADGDSGGVFAFPKDGGEWRRLSLNDRSISVLDESGAVLFAGGFGGLQASTDHGSTWFAADNGLYPQGLPDVNSIMIVTDRIYAGMNFGGVYMLTPPKTLLP
jgi:photosystem II stability/assembly factor-like uncharacterized protein